MFARCSIENYSVSHYFSIGAIATLLLTCPILPAAVATPPASPNPSVAQSPEERSPAWQHAEILTVTNAAESTFKPLQLDSFGNWSGSPPEEGFHFSARTDLFFKTCKIGDAVAVEQRQRLPKTLPPPRSAEDYARLDDNWGMGYLEPDREIGSLRASWEQEMYFSRFGWMSQSILFLYDRPDGNLKGWLVCGWIVEVDRPDRKIPLAPHLIQSGYGRWSYIVLQEQGNWLQFRYSRSGSIGDGIAWISKDELAIGQVDFELVRWRDRFQPDEQPPSDPNASITAGWLFFRDRETPHALRTAPSNTAELITWIGEEHAIEPLEIQGDWMRIVLTKPGQGCLAVDPDAEVREGWIRWRDDQRGTWLTYPPKGC